MPRWNLRRCSAASLNRLQDSLGWAPKAPIHGCSAANRGVFRSQNTTHAPIHLRNPCRWLGQIERWPIPEPGFAIHRAESQRSD